MLNWTREKDKIVGATNSSFLSLIPKENNPLTLNHFRPISLCNTSYKILSKILVNRMKNYMGRLILEPQGGFIAGCQILDNIILVQEAIHSSMERKQQGMAIKLDTANAFNRVNHFFLFETMAKFSFSRRFVRWFKSCISCPWIAPLVNGRPTNFFQATKGLRQGYPLSPFLYLLVAETLNKKLKRMQDTGELKGLKIARGVRDVNHA